MPWASLSKLLLRTHEKIMMSFSWPWKASTVFTSIIEVRFWWISSRIFSVCSLYGDMIAIVCGVIGRHWSISISTSL
jgi:hypothetical protein